MPTHIHLLLKQKQDFGISRYINRCLNSYTRYFNIKHKRKGPLWESRFKSSAITSNEIFTHITRYIHLNPVTAGLAGSPADWDFSSYSEYLSENTTPIICELEGLWDIIPRNYKQFVIEQASYQKELSLIKHLIDH